MIRTAVMVAVFSLGGYLAAGKIVHFLQRPRLAEMRLFPKTTRLTKLGGWHLCWQRGESKVNGRGVNDVSRNSSGHDYWDSDEATRAGVEVRWRYRWRS